MKLLERYHQLNNDISDEFSYLVSQKPYEFFTGEEFLSDDEEDWQYNIYEVRNDIIGNVYDVYILRVDSEGIKIAETENPDKIYYIKLSNIATTLDKINLIEEMKNL